MYKRKLGYKPLLTTILTAMTSYWMCHSAFAVAEITVVNNDGPGEGFNDPTPYTPIGGNPATTLGQARFNAFQFAAHLWGSCLNSDVEILVEAQFDPLPCAATQGILGQAGPMSVFRNFIGSPLANTWYPAALANSLAGLDLNPADEDITATFSSTLNGNVGCLGGLNWYFGLDGIPPGDDIDFVTVVLHELAHGLGFKSFIDLGNGMAPATGAEAAGLDDTFSLSLEHHGATPDLLSDMTDDAQRLAAVVDDPNLHWVGSSVLAEAAAIPLTGGFPSSDVQMFAPNPIVVGSSVSHFHTNVAPDELMEPSYTGPNHNLGLAVNLMQDIGWSLAPKFGTDIVFLLDITGSTGVLITNWVDQIPEIASAWLAFDPNSRFAVASHVDFPYAPHGGAGEWAYRVESVFDPSVPNLIATLDGLTQKVGGDSPESQYEAIYQVLTGEGRDLVDPVNYDVSIGEIPPTSLGQLHPMVIYHFTWPEQFHDYDTDPNYPFAGSKPVAGESAVLAEIAAQSSAMMFFGLTTISDGSSSLVAGSSLEAGGDMVASSSMATASAVADVSPWGISPKAVDPVGGLTPIIPLDPDYPIVPWGPDYPIVVTDPVDGLPKVRGGRLARMAALTGGEVYDVKADLSLLQDAVRASIAHWANSSQVLLRPEIVPELDPIIPDRPIDWDPVIPDIPIDWDPFAPVIPIAPVAPIAPIGSLKPVLAP